MTRKILMMRRMGKMLIMMIPLGKKVSRLNSTLDGTTVTRIPAMMARTLVMIPAQPRRETARGESHLAAEALQSELVQHATVSSQFCNVNE